MQQAFISGVIRLKPWEPSLRYGYINYFQSLQNNIFHSRNLISHLRGYVTLKSTCGKTRMKQLSISKSKILNRYFHKEYYYLSKATHEKKIQKFNETLSSFLSVCIFLGYEKATLQTLNHWLDFYSKRGYSAITINSFNEVFKHMALQGNYDEMKILIRRLKESSVHPNINTFAYILSCIGHLPKCSYFVEEVEATLKWMQEEKINLEEVFSSALFPGDTIQYCLKAVEAVVPDARKRIAIFDTSLETFKMRNVYQNPLVDALNDSLLNNKIPSIGEGVLTLEELMKSVEEQLNAELRGSIEIPNMCIEAGQSVEQTVMESELTRKEKQWKSSLRSSLATLRAIMEMEFATMRNNRLSVFPFLFSLDDEELLRLLITSVKSYRFVWKSDRLVTSLAEHLGQECYQMFYSKYQKTHYLPALLKVYKKYCQWYLDKAHPGSSSQSYVPRVQWEKLLQESLLEGNCLRDRPPEWPFMVRRAVGRLLLNLIVSSVKIESSGKIHSPAFYRVETEEGEKFVTSDKMRDICTPLYHKSEKTLKLPIHLIPMLSPPIPWTPSMSGGYFTLNSDLVRGMSPEQEKIIKESNMYPILDSLNQLGSVPWKVNKTVLEVVKKEFLEIPPNYGFIGEKWKRDRSTWVSLNMKKQKNMLTRPGNRKEQLYHWISLLNTLSLASYFGDKVFWNPLVVDMRGRAISIPLHLTHDQHEDVFRAILYFAEGKKLGAEGLKWLKLHLINQTGHKKWGSFQERLQYCERVMDDIRDSAHNPLSGRRWWANCNAPWQTLAACMELVAAIESGNPETYVSHLPIFQDGSCNVFQHYTALGREKECASSVNLSSSAVPQDLYLEIWEKVVQTLKKEAEAGSEIARALEGNVNRKMIKNVMISRVCGASLPSIATRISESIHPDIYWKSRTLNPTLISEYLVSIIFANLETSLNSAIGIYHWLVNVAEAISKGQSQKVEWVSPLGLPIFQTYLDNQMMLPKVSKQMRAFPPNFIHSLEACHMMLTSIYCQHAGITFVSLHDSFSTHASTVPIMNKICREQFVSLYSLPILEDLAQELTRKYGEHPNFCKPLSEMTGDTNDAAVSLHQLLTDIPQKGELDLNEVLESAYFFR